MEIRRDRCPFFVAALVAAMCGTAIAAPALEVKTAHGRLAGEAAADGLRIYRGIPYAAPPVGALRWREPQPPASWTGVRDATRFGARCMQAAGNSQGRIREEVANLPVSEDCLYLNVWTAAEKPRARQPVIVYIHGGSYIIGTGAPYDGTRFAKRGIVVVTINYRIGAFGLFAHPALTAESGHHSSGNFTFADALSALQWVQQNIAAFGGDPQQVTLMGQSAGGRLIQILRTSPCARGLFKRAIIESAPVRILPMRQLADAERDGVAAAEKVAARSIGELRALPAQAVLEGFPVGQPVIDGTCIVQDSMRALESGRSHDVDLLIGSNADEGTFPYLRAREYGVGFTSAAEYSAYVRDRFGDGTAAFLSSYAATSDTAFDPAQREAFRDETAWLARFSASMHARAGGGRTFLYFFSHRPPAPAQGPDRGASHGFEIPFAFGAPATNWRDEDRRVGEMMSAYWANFAARGDPNGPGLPVWPAVTPQEIQRMNLGPMTAEPGLDAQRLAIFESLYRRMYGVSQR
jgi:para-nitrobenzyl esterase